VETALSSLLSLKILPWQHRRDTGPHKYDLRALIDDLWLTDWCSTSVVIGMRLCCGSTGSGRPEQVTAALGFTEYPTTVHRTRIMLEAS
jgi:hypothetical protein